MRRHQLWRKVVQLTTYIIRVYVLQDIVMAISPQKKKWKLLNNIQKSKADILFVGITPPKKEIFLTKI